ncbi:hypothetical protein GCM10010193_35400 [Kitasatospora atroaurantiaca]|uniref:TetR family transcriptional regulator n=1 Tax=Kitasatospora atroaurantiaca TaxID=285545 RepID=A0A561ETG9_9ACTN|nr:TetR/AcrR family transcriptional regulator [Kitasatospora atroaurantiaca]TWE18912.1 TetR family transcriptional regulator [Kitasatospora atroaurantiaca]
MTDQERVLGLPVPPSAGHGATAQGVVPEQRGPVARELYGNTRSAYEPGRAEGRYGPGEGPYDLSSPEEPSRGSGATRLRVDARRNLESVLRAARQVFGELGYDAPMEEVARRAGVGVGTVYRRFPSKEVLVQRIAAEEVAWLTTQARESLYGSEGPWEALAGYLARAVGSGAGRLLPPSAFRYAEELGTTAELHVPEQRLPEQHVPAQHVPAQRGPGLDRQPAGDADPRLLLHLLAALVARAGAAGELRPGVTVSDVVLVLTAAVPVHVGRPQTGGDGESAPGQPHDAPADRLLQILLNGLRAR